MLHSNGNHFIETPVIAAGYAQAEIFLRPEDLAMPRQLLIDTKSQLDMSRQK